MNENMVMGIRANMILHKISSQATLAERLHLHYNTITKRMHHPETFSVKELRRLFDILDFSDDQILHSFGRGIKD